jgi:Xaa-Pro aminopeptidase
MNRIAEIDHKHDQIRTLLQRHNAGGLWLRQTRNIAWFTAGADASIPVDDNDGAYSILVTPSARTVITTNIEATRLRGEEVFQDLGFEYIEFNWYAPAPPPAGNIITDADAANDLLALRLVLTPSEQDRYRALGQETAAALDEAIRAAQPGDTEYAIAARLDAACRQRGGLAVVNLIASDERISSYRHPKPTDKQLDRYLMIVVCNRKGGLVVSGTRLAYWGALPAEIDAKARKVAAIDAAVMAATRPGRTHAAVFQDLQTAYAAQGETDQWQNHHQGGPTGYNAREYVVTPDNEAVVQAGVAYAWNPSIVGCKSEDTMLVQADGFEILSGADADWPMINVEIDGQNIARPGILEL